MASEERSATTTTVEQGEKVIVTCLVDGLKVSGVLNKSAKNGTVSVKFQERGFDMTAVVKGKGKETKFRKVVKKLPGTIDIDGCKWKADTEKVVLTMKKATDASWAVQLSQRGLEQQSDEEEDD